MDTFENGQSIGGGELRSRAPRHEPLKAGPKANGHANGVLEANNQDEEENKGHGRVKKTFGRTPDGTGIQKVPL